MAVKTSREVRLEELLEKMVDLIDFDTAASSRMKALQQCAKEAIILGIPISEQSQHSGG